MSVTDRGASTPPLKSKRARSNPILRLRSAHAPGRPLAPNARSNPIPRKAPGLTSLHDLPPKRARSNPIPRWPLDRTRRPTGTFRRERSQPITTPQSPTNKRLILQTHAFDAARTNPIRRHTQAPGGRTGAFYGGDVPGRTKPIRRPDLRGVSMKPRVNRRERTQSPARAASRGCRAKSARTNPIHGSGRVTRVLPRNAIVRPGVDRGARRGFASGTP